MSPPRSSAAWAGGEDAAGLAKLLANISDTVTVADESGQVLFVSGQGDGVLGYGAGDWAGRSIFDMVHPDDAARALELAGEVLSTSGLSRSEDLRLIDASGQWADVEVSAVNLIDDPDVRGVVITSRNVSERRRAADDLAAARDIAVAAADDRMRLIAMVSHELRSPLHTIAGTAELLSLKVSDAEVLDAVQQIRVQAELLTKLIDGLLDLGRSEVMGLELVVAPCDVVAIAEQVMASVRRGLFGASVAGVGPRTAVESSPGLPEWVLLDEMRVRQVLTNLVGNALKFTAIGEVVVDVSVAGDDLRIAVRDTGPGIPRHQLDEIFDQYRQTETAAGSRGFGLGLGITRQLVTAMGGSLTVESEVGMGSTFIVLLPLQVERRATERVEREGSVPSTGAAGEPAGEPTVLVVDDSPVNQALLRQQLLHFGVDAIEAEDGQEALRLVDESIALVIMDWHMPGMDGLEATRELRARGWRRPVVGLTASVLDSERATCLAAGMDEVMGKPARLEDIGGLLGRWLMTPQGALDAGPADTDALAKDLGAAAARRLIDTFLIEMPTRIHALRTSIGKDDEAVRQQAHALRSTAELMGSVTLAEICRTMEQSPGSHGIDPDELQLTADRSAEELRRRLARISADLEDDTA
jgi:PAS domain S-box-containing protein